MFATTLVNEVRPIRSLAIFRIDFPKGRRVDTTNRRASSPLGPRENFGRVLCLFLQHKPTQRHHASSVAVWDASSEGWETANRAESRAVLDWDTLIARTAERQQIGQSPVLLRGGVRL